MLNVSAVLNRPDVRAYIGHSWEVAWPMTLIMFYEFLVGLTDVYVAGRVGKDIQATYGFVVQQYFILIVIANALTVGTVSVVSRLFTSGNKDDLSEAVFSSLLSSAAAGIILAGLGYSLAPWVIGLLNVPPELKELSVPFIRIYAAGLFFHYILINSNGVLRSCGMIKASLKTMTTVCLVNIALNLFLVFETPLGYRGIAVATASAVCVGSLMNIRYVRAILIGSKRFSRQLVKRMLDVGWPMGALQILWQLGSTVLFLILSLLPEHRVEVLAALTTGLRLESAIFLPAFAFNMANAVVVGNCLGERKPEDAYKNGLVTMVLGVVIVSALSLVVILSARWIVPLLSNNEIVIKETIWYIYINMIGEPIMASGVILGGGLTGAGDTRSVLTRIALSVWLIRIPLCYLFVVVLGFGPVSVWWAMNVSQAVQAFLIYRRYWGRAWLSNN
jgi:multidrug resistance protein, MATE family